MSPRSTIGVYCTVNAHTRCATPRTCTCTCHTLTDTVTRLQQLHTERQTRRTETLLIARLARAGWTTNRIADATGIPHYALALARKAAGIADTKKTAVVALDPDGQRICPQCSQPLTRKNPHGPGRYPNLCPTCKETPTCA